MEPKPHITYGGALILKKTRKGIAGGKGEILRWGKKHNGTLEIGQQKCLNWEKKGS